MYTGEPLFGSGVLDMWKQCSVRECSSELTAHNIECNR